MLARSLLKKMSAGERSAVREGALLASLGTGAIAYWNYRQHMMKEFFRSEGHYRLVQERQNMTPWKSMYFTWWRMPEEEFNVYHRFRPYFIIGQLD